MKVNWSFGKTSNKHTQYTKTKARVKAYGAVTVCVLRYSCPYRRNEDMEAQYRVTVFLEDRFLEVDLLPKSMTI